MATSVDDFCADGFLVVRGAIAPDIAPAPTHDDLLVFYLPGADDWHSAVTRLKELGVTKQEVVHPGRPGESSGCQVITRPGQEEARMNVHKNARLTPHRRVELVG